MTCKLHARSTDLVLHQTNVPTNSVSKKKKKNAKACLYKEPQKVIILEGPLHDPALYRDSLSLSLRLLWQGRLKGSSERGGGELIRV